MAQHPRGKIIDHSKPGVYHCRSRCVRRAFLCGLDKLSNKDFAHRRDWIEERIRLLAGLFAIDVMFYCVMANHLHLVVRNLPRRAKRWSDQDVIRRACRIFPSKFGKMGVDNGEPSPAQLRALSGDKRLVKEMRKRLSNISWLMRQLKQNIATRANREDGCTGHFFEGRFACVPVADTQGLLVCGVYVDLNQIASEEAATPETSQRTSAFRRIKGLLARQRGSKQAVQWDGFLTPIHTRGDGQSYPQAGRIGAARASDQGPLEMTLEDYLQLLDWTGRQVRPGKRGRISSQTPPILERLGLSGNGFVKFVRDFSSLFGVAVGAADSLRQLAQHMGQRWLQKTKAVEAAQELK